MENLKEQARKGLLSNTNMLQDKDDPGFEEPLTPFVYKNENNIENGGFQTKLLANHTMFAE